MLAGSVRCLCCCLPVLHTSPEPHQQFPPSLSPLPAAAVVQRFLQVGGEPVHTRVAAAMQGRVMALSLQMYGCRVVQKALEVCVCARARGLSVDGEMRACWLAVVAAWLVLVW